MAFGSGLMTMIETGAGLVVGTVGADGEPRATRAWGLTVVDPDARRVRLVMSADDPVTVENLAGGVISVTGADVRTFRSVQVKGTIVAVEPPTADDVTLARDQSDRFLTAIEETDGDPAELMRRILPHEMIAVELVVAEMYDQSPGPGAGTALGRSDP